MATSEAMLAAPKARRRPRRNLAPVFLLLPLVLIFVALFVLPLFAALRFTFNSHVSGGLMEDAWTLANYAKFVGDSFYWRALGNTVTIGLGAAVGAALLGFPFAYLMARSPAARSVQLAALIAPLLVNIVVRAYGWEVLLSETGVVNQLLLKLRIISEPLPLLFNINAVVIALVHVLLPYMVLAVFSSLDGLDPSYEEAARTLGASPFNVFRYIILPLALPGLAAGMVLVFTAAAGSFLVPAILGGGRLNTIPTQVYQYAVGLHNWPFGATLAFVLVLTTLPPLLITQRLLAGRGQTGGRA